MPQVEVWRLRFTTRTNTAKKHEGTPLEGASFAASTYNFRCNVDDDHWDQFQTFNDQMQSVAEVPQSINR